MTTLLTSTLSSSVGRFFFGLGLWLMVLVGAMSMVACAPIKGVPVHMVAQPVMVEQQEVEEVVLLGALPKASGQKGVQNTSFSPSFGGFGFLTVTVTSEWQDVAMKKYCEVAWEGRGVDSYTAVVNGKELELAPVSSISYLTSELGEYILSAKIVGNKVEITNETPTGAVRTRFLSKPSVYKGAKYTGEVAVAKVSTDWYLILADTDKGVHAECINTPESNIIR